MERRAIRSDHRISYDVYRTHPDTPVEVATSSGREDPGLRQCKNQDFIKMCGRVNVRRARGRAGPRRGPRGPGGTSA